MIAANFRKFPEALLAQRELELVFAVATEVTAEAMEVIRKTFAAGGEWIRRYMQAEPVQTASLPAWWVALRHRAKALAKAIRAACQGLF